MKKFEFKLNLFLTLSILFFLWMEQSRAATDSLKYLAHSFVKIKTAKGMVIYIDPNMVNSFEDSADVVLITHEHGDHNDLTRVKRKASCTLIRAANALKSGAYQTFTIGDVTIKAVAAYNSNHPKNSSVGYVLSIPTAEGDTIKLYHAGDTGKISEMADLASQNITYALLPMDGTYTMTPQVAAEAAAMINAKNDIPIHTMPGTPGYSDDRVTLFSSPHKMVVKPGTTISLTNTTTSIEEGSNTQPKSFDLLQNYPNPFNPQTVISYQLSKPEYVKLKVFDSIGREVSELVNKEQTAGNYKISFDGTNIASGVYFYKLTAGEFSSTKKMILSR